MIRILGFMGAGVSFLLCLAIVVIWVRSYWKTDSWLRWQFAKESNELQEFRWRSQRGVIDADPGAGNDRISSFRRKNIPSFSHQCSGKGERTPMLHLIQPVGNRNPMLLHFTNVLGGSSSAVAGTANFVAAKLASMTPRCERQRNS